MTTNAPSGIACGYTPSSAPNSSPCEPHSACCGIGYENRIEGADHVDPPSSEREQTRIKPGKVRTMFEFAQKYTTFGYPCGCAAPWGARAATKRGFSLRSGQHAVAWCHVVP